MSKSWLSSEMYKINFKTFPADFPTFARNYKEGRTAASVYSFKTKKNFINFSRQPEKTFFILKFHAFLHKR